MKPKKVFSILTCNLSQLKSNMINIIIIVLVIIPCISSTPKVITNSLHHWWLIISSFMMFSLWFFEITWYIQVFNQNFPRWTDWPAIWLTGQSKISFLFYITMFWAAIPLFKTSVPFFKSCFQNGAPSQEYRNGYIFNGNENLYLQESG